MTGETLGELIAAYYRAHPCWICREERSTAAPWCSHREPAVTLAEIERLERQRVRRKPVASETRAAARQGRMRVSSR